MIEIWPLLVAFEGFDCVGDAELRQRVSPLGLSRGLNPLKSPEIHSTPIRKSV
jgi:hypothetical protein